MTLKQYLAKTGETQSEFAKRSGVAQAVVCRILHAGDARGRNWALIAIATKGKVRVDDHFPAGGAAA